MIATLAELSPEMPGELQDEILANARLIVAAPEMLAELQENMRVIDEVFAVLTSDEEYDPEALADMLGERSMVSRSVINKASSPSA